MKYSEFKKIVLENISFREMNEEEIEDTIVDLCKSFKLQDNFENVEEWLKEFIPYPEVNESTHLIWHLHP